MADLIRGSSKLEPFFWAGKRSETIVSLTFFRLLAGSAFRLSSRIWAPSSNSTSTSCPASTRLRRSRRQVAKRSVHASTANSQTPMRSGVNEPAQRSLSTCVMRDSDHFLSPGPRKRTDAARIEGPSR